MICVMLLQNCVCCVEGETVSCSETCLTYDFDATGDVSIKAEDVLGIKGEVSIIVEEAIDIKDEIPEARTFPSLKPEQEVSLWGVCEVVSAHVLGHLLPQKGNCEITLNDLLLCAIMWVSSR